MLKGIVFDMDGVLIDSHRIHRDAWRRFLGSVGMTVTDEELTFILEGRTRHDILRHFLGDLGEAQLTEYGQRKDYYFDQNFKDIKPIRGVVQFLDTLDQASISRGIATSASSFRTRKTLRLLNWEQKFKAVVTGDDVAAGKPDPSIYRIAAEQMQCSPDELVAIEDAPCGVHAAISAGIRCIGVSSNGRAKALSQAGAVFIIRDFANLKINELIACVEQAEAPCQSQNQGKTRNTVHDTHAPDAK